MKDGESKNTQRRIEVQGGKRSTVEVARPVEGETPHLLDLTMLRKAIAANGIDGVLKAMIVVCAIEARSLEGVKGEEAERERDRWKSRVFHLKGYKTMAARVEGRS